jgi:hypothetical protein
MNSPPLGEMTVTFAAVAINDQPGKFHAIELSTVMTMLSPYVVELATVLLL